jgi:ankyrin repeat protein
MVLDALGVDHPSWTTPLPDDVLDLFDRARSGSSEVIELLAWGAEPDPVDPCGASPLWYGVRSLSAGIVVALIDAGADAGRRIELSARGERFTTILHEIVRLGRTVALAHALAKGTRPDLNDSDGATPLHVVDGNNDNVNPEMVRALVRAGSRGRRRDAQRHPTYRVRPVESCPPPSRRWSNSAPTPTADLTHSCRGGPSAFVMPDTASATSLTSSTSCGQAAPP